MALYYLSRDLRMAGSGLYVLGPGVKKVQVYAPFAPNRKCGEPVEATSEGWFHYCDDKANKGARALFGEDGGANDPDVVTILRGEPEFSGQTGEVGSLSDESLTFSKGVDKAALADGDILAMVKDNGAVLFEAEKIYVQDDQAVGLAISLGGRFTSPSVVPPGFEAQGAAIFNLKNVSFVTYYVDEATHRLLAVNHDQKFAQGGQSLVESKPVADHIEDLELYYFFENEKIDQNAIYLDPSIGSSRLNHSDPKAIILGLTGRSARRVGRESSVRPSFFNRKRGAKREMFTYNSLITTLQLRNYEKS
jgi:hypothetical protein